MTPGVAKTVEQHVIQEKYDRKCTWIFGAKSSDFFVVFPEVVCGFLDPPGLLLELHALPLLAVPFSGRLTIKVRLAGMRIHLQRKNE